MRVNDETRLSETKELSVRSDLDSDEPIDRLRRQGPRSLSNAEILSFLLPGIVERQAIEDFLEETGLLGLSQLDETFLYTSPWEEGLTTTLVAVAELARRLARVRIPKRAIFGGPYLVANYLMLRYQGDQEVVGALLLDESDRLIAERELYRGTSERAYVDQRDILKQALLHTASGIILFHTHPHGDPTPSAEDLNFTRDLAQAAATIRMKLRDHLVLGRGGRWVSLHERGAV